MLSGASPFRARHVDNMAHSGGNCDRRSHQSRCLVLSTAIEFEKDARCVCELAGSDADFIEERDSAPLLLRHGDHLEVRHDRVTEHQGSK